MYKLLSLIIIAIAASACTNSANLPELSRDACEQGKADAVALCRAQYTAERDLHAALLAVKSREWKLRRQGDTLSANAYINAFRTQLTATDKNLASKVL